MARLIAIEWDHQQLRVLQASSRAGKLEVQHARTWPESVIPNAVQADEAGQRLRERLKEAGIAPGPAVFVVGRDRLLFRDIRYPDVPAAEVPAVVHFQASKELNFPADEAVTDYALSSAPGPLGEKRALAVVIRRELLAAIQKTCKVAGLKLEAVGARPFSILASWLAAHPESAGTNEVQALLVLNHSTGEVCIARGKELLFSRSLTWDSDSPTATPLLSELRRTLAAYAGAFPDQPIRSLQVAGGTREITEPLARGLRLPAQEYDPLAGAALDLPLAERSGFAGLLGAVQVKLAHRRLPVDLLAPKEAQSRGNRKQRYALAASGGVLLLIGAAVAMYGLAVSGRNSRIEELQLQNARLTRDIAAYGDVDKRLEKINEWVAGEIVILDELYDLTAHFPNQPGVRITSLEWKPIAEPIRSPQPTKPAAGKPAAKPVEKPVGELTIEATGEPAALAKLHEALKAGRHWKLDFFDTQSGNQARAKLKIFRQKPADYTASLTTSSVPASSPRGERSERGDRP